MKNKLPIVFFLILVLFVVLSAFLGRSKSADQIAVADAYGRLSGFLTNSDRQAAYEMMSADFRKAHDITTFEFEIEKSMARSFKECDLARGGDARVSGTQANLSIKYTADLGRTFFFVKEGGQWRFTGKTVDYKTSLQ